MSRLHASKGLAREDWCTPEPITARLPLLGRVLFDPCANPYSQVKAEKVVMLPSYIGAPAPEGTDSIVLGSGLKLAWSKERDGYNFVNPPYGRGYNLDWAEKTYREAKRGCNIVSLVQQNLETEWWDFYWEAGAVCLLRGRLWFLGAPSAAPFACALTCFSEQSDFLRRFTQVFSSIGRVVPGRRAQYSGPSLVRYS